MANMVRMKDDTRSRLQKIIAWVGLLATTYRSKSALPHVFSGSSESPAWLVRERNSRSRC